jgi:hypothetical protein
MDLVHCVHWLHLEPTHLLYYTVYYWLHLEPTHLLYYTVCTGYTWSPLTFAAWRGKLGTVGKRRSVS